VRLIIASDIFGRTPHLEALRARICPDSAISELVDPFAGGQQGFADEDEAYAAFLAAGGLAGYKARLVETLYASGEDTALLGFSAGGAAVWLAACDPALPPPRLAISIYARQIRHHAGLVPRCPCRLIFPQSEEGFDVAALAACLTGTPNVTVLSAPYAHGFMNPLSRNFDAAGADEWTRRLDALLAPLLAEG